MTTMTRAKSSKATGGPPTPRQRVEEAIADRIIELLDRGELPPWEKQWRDSPLGNPMNAVSMKPYRGVNRWMTLITQDLMGYEDPRWVTFKQARNLGGTVLRGEKGTQVVFWKRVKKQNDLSSAQQDEEKTFSMLRSYTIFNLAQTEGCSVKDLPEPEPGAGAPIDRAQAIISGMPGAPAIEHYRHENRAPHYNPARDTVRVPNMERYNDAEFYYNTMFHELVHSTGHPKRLARFDLTANSGDLHAYGREELVAAMGAAMLGGNAGIGSRVLELDASYIRHWRDTISGDKPMVIRSATLAQRAVDHILRTGTEETPSEGASEGAAE